MALLLIPLLFVSLVYTIMGLAQVRHKGRQWLILLSGFVVLGLSFPLFIVILDGIAGGFIRTHLTGLWSLVKWLTLADGDIYVGASGFIVVAFCVILLVLQIMLVRNRKSL